MIPLSVKDKNPNSKVLLFNKPNTENEKNPNSKTEIDLEMETG